MRIGIIGAGNVGRALGQGFATAGHQVSYGVRNLGAALPHAGATLDSVRAVTASAEVLVLTTPWSAVEDVLAVAGDFGGKPLLDATNPIGAGLTLPLGHATSGAERVASLARNARVVKAFNSTGFENMQNPRYGEARALMPLAGDDAAALSCSTQLAAELGFEPVSLPSLARARELEACAVLWIKLALQWGAGRHIAYGISRRTPGEALPDAKRPHPPRTIAVVGAGQIGGALARAWLRAGHAVRVGVRDSSARSVEELAALGAQVVPLVEAAVGADVVALAVPGGVALETARVLRELDGKVLIDCCNAIAPGFTLTHGLDTSASEELARALPRVKVVRAFNQQGAEVLQNPSFSGRAAVSFIASDDAPARTLVCSLSADIGLDSVEAGPLASARYLDRMTLLWVALSRALGTREFAISLLRRSGS
jgi:predicted dinucleotide-binding enzyme